MCKSHCHLWYLHAFHATYFFRCCARFLKIAQTLYHTIFSNFFQLKFWLFIWNFSKGELELTNSPKVGDAPHAINVSSADITIDVLEHPILVICHPVRERKKNKQLKIGNWKLNVSMVWKFKIWSFLTGQILNRFRVHVCLASLFILAKQKEDTDIGDGQTERWTTENTANATCRWIKVFHQSRNHFIFLFGMSQTTKTSKAPTVCPFLRVDGNLQVRECKKRRKNWI